MATEKPKTPTPDEVPVTSKKKASKKIIFLIIFLLIAGGLAWYLNIYQKNKPSGKTEVAEPISLAQPIFLQIDPFTVNLKPDGQFLQATFTLQMSAEAEATKVKMYMPQVRSRILFLLSNKTAEEISTVEGKKLLGEQIAALVAEPYQPGLGQTKISNVFFTSFVIQ